MKRNNGEKSPAKTEQEIEDQFMKKVEHELSLPDYDLFSKNNFPHDRSELTISRLRRNGYPIWLRDGLEYRLAPCSRLCNDQQLCRAAYRCS